MLTSFDNITPDDLWSFKDVLRSETNYITHGYHRYPAKFIPQIVRRLILENSCKGDLILDPFGGCGTTLIEAKILGRKSIGLDINPVAKLITAVKISALKPEMLKKSWERFPDYYKQTEHKTRKIIHSEEVGYWFEREMVEDLDILFQSIHKVNNLYIRRFYLCAFSNILKNTSRWLMKSIKPQVDPSKSKVDLLDVFNRQVKQMIVKNNEYYELLLKSRNLSVYSKMYLSDSTKKLPITENSVDLIITSPPYVISYEYADLHQLTLYWLGDYGHIYPRWKGYSNNFKYLKRKFVGTKNKSILLQKKLLSPTAINIVSQLEGSKYARSVKGYFLDMSSAFKQMFRVLDFKRKAAIILGNTTLTGVKINNAEVASELMSNLGFRVTDVIKREITGKAITPLRDKESGQFTSVSNPNKRKIYNYEFIIVVQK